MKTGIYDFKPRQVRALVLLLVLLPCFPTILFLRFMSETLRTERTRILEQSASLYQKHLGIVSGHLSRRLREGQLPLDADPVRIRRFLQTFYQGALGTQVRVAILAPGEAHAPNPGSGWIPLPLAPASETHPGWKVQLFLDATNTLDANLSDQLRVQDRLASITIVILAVISLTAGYAINRRLRLNELRNSAVAAVAHELKTPVASSRLLIDTLLEHRYRDAARVTEYIELLAKENQRLGKTIEDFLMLTRIAQKKFSFHNDSVALGQVLAGAIDRLGPRLHEPECTLHLELPDLLPILKGDDAALETLFVNLLENALKYSGTTKDINLTAALRNRTVEVRISDRGIGIPEDQRKEIFEPFHQVDSSLARTREGCGLGLSIVQSIAKAHRGKVRAESRPGGGTTFVVTLPLPSQPAFEPVPHIPTSPPKANVSA